MQACILCKFAFSRPDLDENKLAKGMCLAIEKREIKKCLSSGNEGRQFFCLN